MGEEWGGEGKGKGKGRGEFYGMYTVSRKFVNWLQSYLKGEKLKTTSVRPNHKPNSSFYL